MDAAYIFGNTGNLSAALGSGWSVEDEFAWAIGTESALTLPLPDGDLAYLLRFDIRPAIFPPKVPCQRLVIQAGDSFLGAFELTTRQTIVVPVPPEVTRGAQHLTLAMLHPDAARPSDHLPVDDARHLALCFHSVSITASGASEAEAKPDAHEHELEPVHGIIAGGRTALRICQIIGKLPSLRGKFAIRYLDLSKNLTAAIEDLPPGTLETMQFCWTELNAGQAATRDAIRNRSTSGCSQRTFYAPIVRALWPFHGPDARAVVEPGRYDPSRYPYGDRLARTLISTKLPDDALYLMYNRSADREPLDLDDIFAGDLRRWRTEGKKTNMQLADFIERHFAATRLFIAPNLVAAPLLREMVEQVLNDALVRDVAAPETLSTELDALLDGYVGWQEEVPVHQRVAAHFKLSWWSPNMTYRWMNNRRTHRDYILDYIRWAPWRI